MISAVRAAPDCGYYRVHFTREGEREEDVFFARNRAHCIELFWSRHAGCWLETVCEITETEADRFVRQRAGIERP